VQAQAVQHVTGACVRVSASRDGRSHCIADPEPYMKRVAACVHVSASYMFGSQGPKDG